MSKLRDFITTINEIEEGITEIKEYAKDAKYEFEHKTGIYDIPKIFKLIIERADKILQLKKETK